MLTVNIKFFQWHLHSYWQNFNTQTVFNNAWDRDQQRIAFSLLISTHDILSMSESTVLKFHYSD